MNIRQILENGRIKVEKRETFADREWARAIDCVKDMLPEELHPYLDNGGMRGAPGLTPYVFLRYPGWKSVQFCLMHQPEGCYPPYTPLKDDDDIWIWVGVESIHRQGHQEVDVALYYASL